MKMLAAVYGFREEKMNRSFILLLCFLVFIFVSGCQKSQSPDASPTSTEKEKDASVAASSSATGIAKSATHHTDDSANVTKWWDLAEKKNSVQIARDQKIAKEANDQRLAQEAKILAARTAASARELTRVQPVIAPITTVAKAVVLPLPVEIATRPTPTPVLVGTTPPQDMLKFISGTQPVFPKAAAKDGVTQGMIRARVFIEKNGSVSKVEIIEAQPRGYFEKEVVKTVSAWKYSPISNAQTTAVEFSFKTEL